MSWRAEDFLGDLRQGGVHLVENGHHLVVTAGRMDLPLNSLQEASLGDRLSSHAGERCGVCLTDHHAIDRFRGVADPPAEAVHDETVVTQDVPERFGAAVPAREKPHFRLTFGIGNVEEVRDAVLLGGLPCCYRCPDHGGLSRTHRGEVAERSRFHQTRHYREIAFGQEGQHHVPL